MVSTEWRVDDAGGRRATFCDCELDAATLSRCALGNAGWGGAGPSGKKELATAYIEEIVGVSIPTNPTFERTPHGYDLTYLTWVRAAPNDQLTDHVTCNHNLHRATFADDGLLTSDVLLSSVKAGCP